MTKLQQTLGIVSLLLFALIIPFIVGMLTGRCLWSIIVQIIGLAFHCLICGLFIGTDKIITQSELYGIDK